MDDGVRMGRVRWIQNKQRRCVCLFKLDRGQVCFLFSPVHPAGPPVNVAMAIEVASIDHISEANMVKYSVLHPSSGRSIML